MQTSSLPKLFHKEGEEKLGSSRHNKSRITAANGQSENCRQIIVVMTIIVFIEINHEKVPVSAMQSKP